MAAIFHVTGSSGSGKTTLGHRLSALKLITVIDIDDVDDKVACRLLNDRKYTSLATRGDEARFLKEKDKLVGRILAEMVNRTGWPVVLLGHPELMVCTPTAKFMIKSDPVEVNRRINLRTLDSICHNAARIRTLLSKRRISSRRLGLILLFKYKIRLGFYEHINDTERRLKRDLEERRKLGYKVRTTDEIYAEIMKHV